MLINFDGLKKIPKLRKFFCEVYKKKDELNPFLSLYSFRTNLMHPKTLKLYILSSVKIEFLVSSKDPLNLKLTDLIKI